MEAFWVCLILFLILVIAFVFAGGYLLIDHSIGKRAKNKWYKALATNSTLRELLDIHNKLWKVYDQKSNIANGYKKQIDHLLGNLTYLPNYECEWRKSIKKYILKQEQKRISGMKHIAKQMTHSTNIVNNIKSNAEINIHGAN